jgi:hypothetical protein
VHLGCISTASTPADSITVEVATIRYPFNHQQEDIMRGIADRLLSSSMISADNAMGLAKAQKKPVILICGRGVMLAGVAEKLFYKTQSFLGRNPVDARKHCYQQINKYTDRLNAALNKIR